MARYYGVVNDGKVRSAASAASGLAPEALGSLFGANLASGTAQAAKQPLPLSLGGVAMTITDSSGAQRSAPLVYVSPGQINFQVPEGVAGGPATFSVGGQSLAATVQPVAPGLFSVSATGTGVAAALAVTVQTANPQMQSPVTVFACGSAGCTSTPISWGLDQQVYVSFYGTGIRNRSSQANVNVTICGVAAPVQYAGAAPGFAGLDQVNVSLPRALQGSGECIVALTVDGQSSNEVTISVK
jgi:uncharacterized protein (TIGR03437 family)